MGACNQKNSQSRSLALIHIILLWITCVQSKGADSSSSDAQTLISYGVVPRDPVLAGSQYASTQPDQSLEGIYESYTLDEFDEYYAQYRGFIGTKQHIDMKGKITDATLVCVNYSEVKNNTNLGLFTCPLPFELSDFTSCCGENYAEFCCYPTYGETDNIATNAIFLCTLVSIVVFAAVVYLVVGRYV